MRLLLSNHTRILGFSSFLFALLQTLCPAVIAISGLRVIIGLTALAGAAGTDAPAHGWHADAIRIPIMILALLGACLNLFVVWQIRRLRKRPASQWRLGPIPKEKLSSERLQITLAVLTFVCLGAEWWTHGIIHHVHS